MKIYTSRYSNKNLADSDAVKLGITLGAPRFPLKFKLSGNIRQFAPPRYIFGMEDEEAFKRKYLEHLDKLGADGAKLILDCYSKEDQDIVLLCYEDVTKPGDWCHRRMLAEWLEKNVTGYPVEEYPDDNAYGVKHANDKLGNSVEDQMKLF